MKDKIIDILKGQNMEIHEYSDKTIIISDYYRIDVYGGNAHFKFLTDYNNPNNNKKFTYNGIETYIEIKEFIEYYKQYKIEELRRM